MPILPLALNNRRTRRLSSPLARLVLLVPLVAAGLAGCVSSRTFVLQPVTDGQIHGQIALEASPASVKVEEGAAKDFEAALAKHLREYVGATTGRPADLVVQYRFVLFDQGSGVGRVGSGLAGLAGSPVYGIGDGAIGVEIVYKRTDGTTIGQIVTDGPISGAFGTTSGALDSAALAVAKYTKANFTCRACGDVGHKSEEPMKIRGLRAEAYAPG
jgi:hypothetical protein